MNRIDQTFQRLKGEGRKALIGYITAGFPDKSSFATLVPLVEKAGVDILEVGVPFSDPIADGPTIQESSFVALQGGVTLAWIINQVKSLRASVKLPIVFMSYSNPILAYGSEKFFKDAKAAGVDGLIVPDLIPEEAPMFESWADEQGIHLIFLVAPTTLKGRLKTVAQKSRGFLYAVSLTGVTGARTELPAGLPAFLKSARQVSKAPVAVGFGLSTPDQVRQAAAHVDGVIVGSALIKEISKSRSSGFSGVDTYVRSLRSALDSLPSERSQENSHAS